MGKPCIDHGHLIDDHNPAFNRILFIIGEALTAIPA